MQPPLVSVWMITYNHEKYIRQCLESVVSQQTSFPIEVIIGEDCSTDGTRAIVKEFEARYPDIIKPVYQAVNVGAMRNAYEFCYPRLTGKYVACLEGDDYWTDDHKLQKQVDLMEKNPDYAVCFHQVNLLYNENEFQPSELFSSVSGSTVEFTIEDLATRSNFMHSPGVLFRHFLIPEFPSWFRSSAVGDYVLHMLNARKGKIVFIPSLMAVYRVHNQGIWSMRGQKYQLANWLNMLENLIAEFNDDKGISEKLKVQFAKYAIDLADIYQKEGSKEESAAYLKKGFAVSECYMNDWVNEIKENYAQCQKEFSQVVYSKEYRIGKHVKNPVGLMRKILSVLKRKIVKRNIVHESV